MPPTDGRLPGGPSLRLSLRRADVTAFWLLGTGLVMLATGSSAAALQVERWWIPSLLAGVVLVAPGAIWSPWFETGVRGWNMVVREAAALLRRYVTAVCYYVVLVPVGSTGSTLDAGSRTGGTSRWVARGNARPTDTAAGSRPRAAGHWYDGVLEAARRPGSGWVLSRLPVVWLLRLLRNEEHESAPPSATYTLY